MSVRIQTISELESVLQNENHTFENADMHGANLQGLNLDDENLDGANLNEAKLQRADFLNVSMKNVNLNAANLEKAKIKNTNLYKTNLVRANLTGVVFTENSIVDTNLSNANLTNAEFYKTNISKSLFNGADLTKAQIFFKNINHSEFKQTILKETQFHKEDENSEIVEANFTNTIFDSVDFKVAVVASMFKECTFVRTIMQKIQKTYCVINGCLFENEDFTHSVFYDCVFENCVFKGPTVFFGAEFQETKFKSCTFQNGVNFEKAKISHGEFEKCAFRAASFNNSFIENTLFTKCSGFDEQTTFTRAKLEGVEFTDTQLHPNTLRDIKKPPPSIRTPRKKLDQYDKPFVLRDTDTYYDLIEMDDVNVKKFLEDDPAANIVFALILPKKTYYYGITREDFSKHIESNNNIIFECNGKYNFLNFTDKEFKRNFPYTRISGILFAQAPGSILISKSDAEKAAISEERIFIIDTVKHKPLNKFKYSISGSVIYEGNAVSAKHCNEPDDAPPYFVYKLYSATKDMAEIRMRSLPNPSRKSVSGLFRKSQRSKPRLSLNSTRRSLRSSRKQTRRRSRM